MRLLDAVSRNVFNQRRLLIFQWRMAIKADPRVFVLDPIGMEERILVCLRVDTAFPFLVNRLMALTAGFGLQTVETGRDSETE